MILCGNSILIGLDNNRVSSDKINVQLHPLSGANSLEMIDIVKPLAKRNPDRIIVHVATNDLNVKEIDTIKNLEKIRSIIKKTNSQCEMVLSECIIRTDRKGMKT